MTNEEKEKYCATYTIWIGDYRLDGRINHPVSKLNLDDFKNHIHDCFKGDLDKIFNKMNEDEVR
jgi:hypothetical protein